MSSDTNVLEQLKSIYNDLPAQLRAAAHWVIQHPDDVALLSMRDQARRAGVPPATMTRLAQRIGYSGFDEVRERFANAVRRGPAGFSARAVALLERRHRSGEDALVSEVFDTTAEQIRHLGSIKTVGEFRRAADIVTGARRIYCLGQRASYPVAFQLAYMCNLIGRDARLIDAPGGTGVDQLRDANEEDVCIAVSVRPYTRSTLTLTEHLTSRKVRIIGITDSEVSPLCKLSSVSLIVGVETPSFFHTLTPAFAAIEAIVALVAAGAGSQASDALNETERQLDSLQTLLMPRTLPQKTST